MTSREPGYSHQDYVSDRKQAAYDQARQQNKDLENFPVGDALAELKSKAEAADVAGKYSQQQTSTLSTGQELREKPGALGNTNYLSYDHKDLDKFVKENFDTNAVHEVGRLYNDHGNKLIEFSNQIRQAAAKTAETWKGAAGDAMRAHVTQVADHMGRSGQAAQLTANQVGMQGEAGERAKNSMPEVVPFDLKQEMSNFFSDPNPFTAVSRANDIVEKHDQSQAAHQEAAQVMSTMEGSFGQAAAGTPAFVPAPTSPVDQPAQPPQNKPEPVGEFTTPNTPGTSSSPSQTSSSWAGPPGDSVSPPVSTPSPGQPPPAGTNPVWQQPVSPPGGDNPGRNPPDGRGGVVAPGQMPPGQGGGAGGRAGGAGGRVGGAGGAQPGAGGRAGAGGLGGSGAGATSGSSAAGGRAGTGGVMGGAGAAGRGQEDRSEDDQEHESKYLLGTDEVWEDLDLPKVAPPVFGDWDDNDH
jgi:hypothetical protein